MRRELDEHMPKEGDTIAQKKEAFRGMRAAVLAKAEEFFLQFGTFTCECHRPMQDGTSCFVAPAAALACPLPAIDNGAWWASKAIRESHGQSVHINLASTMCSGWSPAGTRLGEAHDSERSHCLWLGERRARALQGLEEMYFHENRPEYPVELLQASPLRSTHVVLSVVIDPRCYGEPMTRLRRFSFGYVFDRFVYVGSGNAQEEFDALFGRTLTATGDAYLGTVSELVEEYKDIAKRNHMYLSDGDVDASFDMMSMLTAEQKSRMRAWKEQAAQSDNIDDVWFADIKDWPRGSTPKKTMPTFLKSSLIYSSTRQGLVSTREAMRCHGFRSGIDSGDPCADWLDIAFSKFKVYERQALVGSSLHAPLYAAWLFFCLSNLVERKVEDPQCFPSENDFFESDDSGGACDTCDRE